MPSRFSLANRATAAAQTEKNIWSSFGKSITIIGVKGVVTNLRNIAANAPGEAGRALYQEAKVEQKESMKRTPVLTGALRASHETTLPQYEGHDVWVKIVVGGPAAPYAVAVHEVLEVDHPNGQAKFLESTLMESRSHMGSRIARRINLNRMRKFGWSAEEA